MRERQSHIRAEFSRLRHQSRARHRDIAATLGISEADLLAAHEDAALQPGGVRVIRMRPQWPEVLGAAHCLGTVMALTRNASCILENVGRYGPLGGSPSVGSMTGNAIDLRIFFSHWTHGFAVRDQSGPAEQCSLQFFDPTGTAVHKIFLLPESHSGGFAEMISRFGLSPSTWEPIGPTEPRPVRHSDRAQNPEALRTAWAAMRDVHEFHELLRHFSLQRLEAFRLAGQPYAREVGTRSLYAVLAAVIDKCLPVMIFAGNPGALQIHSGILRNLTQSGVWTNIMDPDFNLHLRHDHIASAWVVTKPSEDGPIVSLELFDPGGEVIAMLFGARLPGEPQPAAWSSILDTYATEIPA
jgi:putative hemin transport protein